MTPKLKLFAITALLGLGLDQLSKYWIVSHLSFADRITVIDGFFYITHVRNPGAAFSLFATADHGLRMFFFVGISLLAIGIIFSFYRKLAPGDRLPSFALGAILGGASGNLVDRLFRNGEVVDFLHFKLWSGYSWPDFNFADTFIVVGVGLLILELLVSEGEDRASGATADDAPGEDAAR